MAYFGWLGCWEFVSTELDLIDSKECPLGAILNNAYRVVGLECGEIMHGEHLQKEGFPFGHVLLAVIGGVASSAIGILPLIIGALAEHRGLDLDDAGYILTINIFGIAAGALFSTALLRRMLLSPALALSICILAMAEAVSALSHDVMWLSVMRFVSGVGAGLVSGCIAAAIVRLPRPQRGFALYMVGMFSISVIGLYSLPAFISVSGATGLFWLLAILSGTCLALVPMLKLPSSGTDTELDRQRWRADITSSLLFGFIFFLMVGNGGLWAFIERAGETSNYSPQRVGNVLALGSFLGICAALAVGPAERRFMSRHLLAISGGMAVIAAILLAGAYDSLAIFVIGIQLMSIVWAFIIPVAQNMLAEHNHNDSRVATLSMLMYWCGLAVGPSFIGYVLAESDSYVAAFLACAFSYGLAFICGLLLFRSKAVPVQFPI